MTSFRSYKYKLYRSKRNEHLHRQIDVAGQLWNHMIRFHRTYYRLHKKHLTKFDLMKRLTQICKREKYKHYKVVGSQARQDVVERIDKAYKKFFDDLKRKIKTSPPKFKHFSKYKSFTLKQCGWNVGEENKVRIQKHSYKFWKSREVPHDVKTVTIKRDGNGDLWIIFCCKVELGISNRQVKSSVGFDMGLKTFLVGSDGSEVHAPLFMKNSLDKIRRKSRNLSRKTKGSNRRKKAVQDLARQYRKIESQRRDWQHKTANELISKYDQIFLEDLCIKGMSRLWGRKMSDIAFSEFKQKLIYKAEEAGVTIHSIDRFFPSTKMCGSCGVVNKNLTLADREWTCECGVRHSRDQNASNNILREGASSLAGIQVRAASAAAG